MRFLLLVMLFIGGIFTLTAQNLEAIHGKWEFKDVSEKEKAKLDSNGLEMVPVFFNGMFIFFNEDGRYRFNFMDKLDVGEWKWSANEKKVELLSDEGQIFNLEIEELKDSVLVMKFSKGTFIMNKTNPTQEDLKLTESASAVCVSATLEQMAKKWYLKTKEGAKVSARQAEIDKMLSKDLYIKLHKNGKFDAEVLVVEDRATWVFGKDNKSIIISANDRTVVWYIHSVTDNELILIRGKSPEKWIFTTKLPWR